MDIALVLILSGREPYALVTLGWPHCQRLARSYNCYQPQGVKIPSQRQRHVPSASRGPRSTFFFFLFLVLLFLFLLPLHGDTYSFIPVARHAVCPRALPPSSRLLAAGLCVCGSVKSLSRAAASESRFHGRREVAAPQDSFLSGKGFIASARRPRCRPRPLGSGVGVM